MKSKQLLANVLLAEGKERTKFYQELGVKGKVQNTNQAHLDMSGCNFKDFTPEELKKLKRIKFKQGDYTKAIEQALLVQQNEVKKEAVKPTSSARRPTEPR